MTKNHPSGTSSSTLGKMSIPVGGKLLACLHLYVYPQVSERLPSAKDYYCFWWGGGPVDTSALFQFYQHLTI